jgi:glycosyltransferase involved in cell wall biosynthesis
MNPKYSVIIPTRNGVSYILHAIDSVLSQNYPDIELIVSDNHSSDGTSGLLAALSDPRLRIVRPPEPLSMVRHFEFALAQAAGEWITVIGDDDGLQPYFFTLAEKLTDYPNRQIIGSRRAYFFWPGCESLYQNTVVSYHASHRFEMRSSFLEFARLLILDGHYFEAPQFYTGTLFRRSLIDAIASKHSGQIFHSRIVDAYSAALIFHNVPNYLFSHLPLVWIGSSPKSNGFAETTATRKTVDIDKRSVVDVKEDFLKLNNKDNIVAHKRFRNSPDLADPDVYFLEALFQLHDVEQPISGDFLTSKPFTYLLFAKIHRNYQRLRKNEKLRKDYLDLFQANDLKVGILSFLSEFMRLACWGFIQSERALRLARKVLRGNASSTACEHQLVSDSKLEHPSIAHASIKTMLIFESITKLPLKTRKI